MNKIGTKENAGDLLTKHIKPEAYHVLLDETGYRAKLASDCVEHVKLERVNKVSDLKPAGMIANVHEENMQRLTCTKALAFLANDKDADELTLAES